LDPSPSEFSWNGVGTALVGLVGSVHYRQTFAQIVSPYERVKSEATLMKFQFTLSSANLKSAVFSFSLFLLFSSFFSFQIYLNRLHTASKISLKRTGPASIEEFIAGIPQPQSSSSLAEPSELVIVTTLETASRKSDCTPFSVASHFEPTKGYKQSTKLPQWMKGTMDRFFDFLRIFSK
jgi:hypothetical protein